MVTWARPAAPGTCRLEDLGPAARPGIAVGERGEERAVEGAQRVDGAPVEPGARAARGEAHQQRQLARAGAEPLVGEGRVVGGQDVVGHVRGGGPLHEEARAERRQLLGQALVVEQHLLHGDRAVGVGVTGPGQSPAKRGVGGVQRGVGGHDPAHEARAGGEQGQPDRPAPVLHHQGEARRARARRRTGSAIRRGPRPSGPCGPGACPNARTRPGPAPRRAAPGPPGRRTTVR